MRKFHRKTKLLSILAKWENIFIVISCERGNLSLIFNLHCGANYFWRVRNFLSHNK